MQKIYKTIHKRITSIGYADNATQVIGKFKTLTKNLNDTPMAVLVTRKTGDHFVFLNARLYQELVDIRFFTMQRHQEAMEVYGKL